MTSIASSLTGGTVSMKAGNDLNITGSAVVGDDTVKLAAGKDINIAAAIDTNSEWNHVEQKQSGLLSGGGGFGISYGTRTTTTDQTRDAVTQSGQARSLVGSIGGDLTLDAGNAIKVSGTDMSAGRDMGLTAKDVTIDAGKDKIDTKFETRVVQDAISLRVGGSVVNAIQSVQSVQQTVQATDNKRVQAMAAATAALAVEDAAARAKDGLSVSLSLTAGHSESVQTTTTSETLHTGSALTAGRDISIVAKGGEGSGNINVIASDINAGRNVTLAANNQVNMVAAQDLESQHSESKSISAEAGVAASYSTNGGPAIGFTAAVSASKGHDDGEGTTQVNTKVNAGQTLTIVSGGDTNIKGAVVSGNQVVADVGGNLNLQSLQDTAKFDSKTQSVSVSGTYGYGASVSGSANQTTIKSDYASVQEQSGIRAGDGGFQITVGGNTDLKGAVISSTQAGTVANSLVTKTLTQSEIENYSKMEASSIGLSGSITSSGGNDKEDNEKRKLGQNPGAGKGLGGTNAVDVAATNATGATPSATAISVNANSTTRSGISAGAITITSDAAQSLAGLDRTAVTGTDTSGKLDNKFNAAETQTALQVTEQFTQTVVATAAPVAAKLVGDIAGMKEADAKAAEANYKQLAFEARNAGDKIAEKDYDAQAKAAGVTAAAWGDDGIYRLALHATAQGAIGSMAGGNAGAVGGVVGVVGGNVGKQVGKFLADAQAEGLSEADRKELVNTYQQTMATLGGAVAGIAAGSGTSNAGMLANAVQSATTGMTVDVNNRQLHEKETAWIRENAVAFADQVNAARRASGDTSGVDITPEEAAKQLAQQAAKDTDFMWRSRLDDVDNPAAEAFLKSAGNLTFTNSDGKQQAFFTIQGAQLFAPEDGLASRDISFLDKYVKTNAHYDVKKGVAEEGLEFLAGSNAEKNPNSVVSNIDDPVSAFKDKLSSTESGAKLYKEGMAASVDPALSAAITDTYKFAGEERKDLDDAIREVKIVQAASNAANTQAAGKGGSANGGVFPFYNNSLTQGQTASIVAVGNSVASQYGSQSSPYSNQTPALNPDDWNPAPVHARSIFEVAQDAKSMVDGISSLQGWESIYQATNNFLADSSLGGPETTPLTSKQRADASNTAKSALGIFGVVTQPMIMFGLPEVGIEGEGGKIASNGVVATAPSASQALTNAGRVGVELEVGKVVVPVRAEIGNPSVVTASPDIPQSISSIKPASETQFSKGISSAQPSSTASERLPSNSNELTGRVSDSVKVADFPVFNPAGAVRAEKFSDYQQKVSAKETIFMIAGENPIISYTESGKTLYRNPESGLQVVYDNAGRYFRVEDTNVNGPLRYTDQFGQPIPNNVPLLNKRGTSQTGVPSDVRKALTHFTDSD
ncbi:hemagglutinin repeat-containing protein [Massilia phyllosphaerae]|uniref:hemagglutinin repeat-containing protein n=1 Tax=Massilia phyllosphaerae TaxID=3106034 RepID=UPI002B1CC9B0|nr:hemagglutinin repeat-containing protein [Massilia sp. SGZ-792]